MPDIVICDIEMPRLKGFDVLTEMRKDPKTAAIPFVFLTGKTDISYLTKAMELDVDDFRYGCRLTITAFGKARPPLCRRANNAAGIRPATTAPTLTAATCWHG